MAATYYNATAMDVREGDIILIEVGYRVLVSGVNTFADDKGGFYQQYTLNSKPNEQHNRPLPETYEGMHSGGNRLAHVAIQKQFFVTHVIGQYNDRDYIDRWELHRLAGFDTIEEACAHMSTLEAEYGDDDEVSRLEIRDERYQRAFQPRPVVATPNVDDEIPF